MKINYSLFFILLIILNSCNNKSFAPNIQFESADLQIGFVKSGEIKNLTTTIKNTGNKQLIIEKISAGCNCTDVEILKDTLEPNQETRLMLTYIADSLANDNDFISIPIVIRSNTDKKYDEFYLSGTIRN